MSNISVCVCVRVSVCMQMVLKVVQSLERSSDSLGSWAFNPGQDPRNICKLELTVMIFHGPAYEAACAENCTSFKSLHTLAGLKLLVLVAFAFCVVVSAVSPPLPSPLFHR